MFFLVIFIMLFCNQVMAMQKHAFMKNKLRKEHIIKTARNGNRIILPLGTGRKNDFLYTPEQLMVIIQQRVKEFGEIPGQKKSMPLVEYGDSKESFMQHHLKLLVLAFQRNNKAVFKELLQLPDITTTAFSWQELKENPDNSWSCQQETGTIRDHVIKYRQDALGNPIADFEYYWQLIENPVATASAD